jgi:hypothetical protein
MSGNPLAGPPRTRLSLTIYQPDDLLYNELGEETIEIGADWTF